MPEFIHGAAGGETSADQPAVYVGVGPLPPEPADLLGDGRQAPYWGYGIQVELARDRGLRFAPVGGPERSQVAIWRAHGGATFKVATWVAQRFNAPPELPSTDTGDPNDVLLYDMLSPAMPQDMPDGDKLFTVVGQYVYVLQVSPGPTDPILIPNSPLRAPAMHLLNPADFTRYLIGPSPGVSGFSGPAVTF